IRQIRAYVRAHRTTGAPFDIVQAGVTPGTSASEDSDIVAPYVSAGATWWLESVLPWKRPFEEARARIRKGPPRM
ncbi:MAG TPA: hypothetical protein VIX12_07925, partial [Candidatus Binataceae bacterium]